MITVDVHPEFGIELALSLPYAYWLHEKILEDGPFSNEVQQYTVEELEKMI